MSPTAAPAPPPSVCVRDAALLSTGGPIRVCVAHLPPVAELAAALRETTDAVHVDGHRLTATVQPPVLEAALDRVVAPQLAAQVQGRLHTAIEGWLQGPRDLPLAPGAPAPSLPTSRRTVVQAVLNVTPDSFSDGGTYLTEDGDPTPAIAAGRRMLQEGADLVDVGGESTRPGAEPVAEQLELERTVPVVRALAAEGAVVSIDTTKAAVARAAVDAGAAIVNDVSAGALDPQLIPTVAELEVPYVLMHMRGTPRTMQQNPEYDDVVADVYEFLAAGLDRVAQSGIPAERVVVDPGIGFGKTVEHNLALLARLRELTSLGRPVLFGASRKSFIGTVTGVADAGDRLEGSLAVATLAVAAGARIVRVHDVVATVRAVALADALRR